MCGESIDFDPTGKIIVTGSYANTDTIKAFSWDTGETVFTVPWTKSKNSGKYCPLYSLKVISPLTDSEGGLNEPLIVVGGGAGGAKGNNEVRVFGLETKKVTTFSNAFKMYQLTLSFCKQCLGSIYSIPGAVNTVDLLPSKKMIMFGGGNNELNFFEIKYGFTEEQA